MAATPVLIPVDALDDEAFERLRMQFALVPPLDPIEILEIIRHELDTIIHKTGRGATMPERVLHHVQWLATVSLVQRRLQDNHGR